MGDGSALALRRAWCVTTRSMVKSIAVRASTNTVEVRVLLVSLALVTFPSLSLQALHFNAFLSFLQPSNSERKLPLL
jgi:hypothetical protein